jgi:hypothetical protein
MRISLLRYGWFASNSAGASAKHTMAVLTALETTAIMIEAKRKPTRKPRLQERIRAIQ